jgi:hypothetical protein
MSEIIPWTDPGGEPCCCEPAPCAGDPVFSNSVTATLSRAKIVEIFAGGTFACSVSASVAINGASSLGEVVEVTGSASASSTPNNAGGCERSILGPATTTGGTLVWTIDGVPTSSNAQISANFSYKLGYVGSFYFAKLTFDGGAEGSIPGWAGGVRAVTFPWDNAGSEMSLNFLGSTVTSLYNRRRVIKTSTSEIINMAGSFSVVLDVTHTPAPP